MPIDQDIIVSMIVSVDTLCGFAPLLGYIAHVNGVGHISIFFKNNIFNVK